jgi:hypothetical protein
VTLQEELTKKRETAVLNLITAMVQIYPEQVPADVRQPPPSRLLLHVSHTVCPQVDVRGRLIAKIFEKERFATKRELNSLSRLAAEAAQIFPPDFVSATQSKVTETMKQVFGRNQTSN